MPRSSAAKSRVCPASSPRFCPASYRNTRRIPASRQPIPPKLSVSLEPSSQSPTTSQNPADIDNDTLIRTSEPRNLTSAHPSRHSAQAAPKRWPPPSSQSQRPPSPPPSSAKTPPSRPAPAPTSTPSTRSSTTSRAGAPRRMFRFGTHPPGCRDWHPPPQPYLLPISWNTQGSGGG